MSETANAGYVPPLPAGVNQRGEVLPEKGGLSVLPLGNLRTCICRPVTTAAHFAGQSQLGDLLWLAGWKATRAATSARTSGPGLVPDRLSCFHNFHRHIQIYLRM